MAKSGYRSVLHFSWVDDQYLSFLTFIMPFTKNLLIMLTETVT